MVKYLKEFTNNGGSSNSSSSTSNEKSVLDLVKQYRFQADENTTDEQGLVIAPNGMVGVQYSVENGVSIRPDNDLNLNSQDLAKFKQDLTQAEKLASAISNAMK